MADKLTIDQLKTPKEMAIPEQEKVTEAKEETKAPAGRNIDGNELRTFEGGLKEFDPLANGFESKSERFEGSSDIDNALNNFDKMIEKRKDTINKYNELLDQYGGAISEEDLRKELGEDYLTANLQDGAGGKYEDAPGKAVAVDETGKATEVDSEDESTEADTNENVEVKKKDELSELDELERELEMDDDKIVPIPQTVELEMPVEEVKKEVVPEVKESVPEVAEVKEIVKEEPKQENTVVKQADQSLVKTEEISSSDNNVLAGNLTISERKNFSGELSEIDEDKDLSALDEDDNYTPPVDDFNEKLKAELEKKMRPVSKKFDLSHAVISKEPITVNNALNKFIPADRKTFTWALIQTRVPITMRSFTATELEHLNEIARDNQNREVFQTIYEHVVVPRSKTFETWAKCVSYFDVDHIWFAIYCACFADSNYLPFTCRECNQLTVTTDIPISKMVTYKDDATKELHNKIRSNPPDPDMTNKFPEYLLQVSDDLVFGFREPSIYDAIIAPTLYDSDFTSKYQDIIGLSAYVSGIYSINYETNQLQPIATKIFANNESKTMKAKIIQYSKIVRALTSDQYNVIMRHISTMTNENLITYGLPSTTCDHCKKEIPGDRMAAYDLVFIRHRLGLLGA